jgi:hypothetical protein
MVRTLAPRESRAKGFVSMSRKSPRNVAFSAYPVTKSTFTSGREARAISASFRPLICGSMTSHTMKSIRRSDCKIWIAGRASDASRTLVSPAPRGRRRVSSAPSHRLPQRGSFLLVPRGDGILRLFQVNRVPKSARQVKLDGRAMSHLAIDAKMATGLFDEAIDRRKPKARARSVGDLVGGRRVDHGQVGQEAVGWPDCLADAGVWPPALPRPSSASRSHP